MFLTKIRELIVSAIVRRAVMLPNKKKIILHRDYLFWSLSKNPLWSECYQLFSNCAIKLFLVPFKRYIFIFFHFVEEKLTNNNIRVCSSIKKDGLRPADTINSRFQFYIPAWGHTAHTGTKKKMFFHEDLWKRIWGKVRKFRYPNITRFIITRLKGN